MDNLLAPPAAGHEGTGGDVVIWDNWRSNYVGLFDDEGRASSPSKCGISGEVRSRGVDYGVPVVAGRIAKVLGVGLWCVYFLHTNNVVTVGQRVDEVLLEGTV